MANPAIAIIYATEITMQKVCVTLVARVSSFQGIFLYSIVWRIGWSDFRQEYTPADAAQKIKA